MGHSSPFSPRVDRRHFAVEVQNRCPTKDGKYCAAFQIESVDLRVSAEKSARDVRRKGDAMASPREKCVVARV